MKDIELLLEQLTLQEKAALLEGYHTWMTHAVPRLGIDAVYMTDGPLGVRKKRSVRGSGVMGLGGTLPSTAFPAPAALACGWDTALVEQVSRAIARECRAYDVQILLAPGLNLKRDPRCGRNFEYFSEDPLLAGELGGAYCRGVEDEGVAACVKHFALNNSENYRYMGDSVVDERAARELYLKVFEIAIEKGRPRTVMCGYNKINGVHCSENRWLLTDVLRGQWGFQGLVMTDWGATRDRVAGVQAGLDLDMPGGIWHNRRSILRAVSDGRLQDDALNASVRRVLRLVASLKEAAPKKEEPIDPLFKPHHQLAVEAACQCAVLLQNDGILPLDPTRKVLVAGRLFERMRYQGAGSSALRPARLVSPREAFDQAGIPYQYVRGYRTREGKVDHTLVNEALQASEGHDTVLVFAGLTELYESEGYDRRDLRLPANQIALIEALASAGKRIVLVLFGGAVVELPFAERMAAILSMALPGQGGGEAARRLLFGEANPCGKLSETWMRSTEDIPFGAHFGRRKIEVYRENIFMGYRFYDEAPERIRYPFGHGLSYTSFAYRDLDISPKDAWVEATLTVENTGGREGAEVVQLYAGRNADSAVFKAAKQLCAFEKIWLMPGESRRVSLRFPLKQLSYYHTGLQRWILEPGVYPLWAGGSSRVCKLQGAVTITEGEAVAGPYHERVMAAYRQIARCDIPDAIMAETLGGNLPQEPPVMPYTLESPLEDYKNSAWGQFVYRIAEWVVALQARGIRRMPEGEAREAEIRNYRFVRALMPRNSPRSLVQSGGGIVQMNAARALVALANGHPFQALRLFLHHESPRRRP